MPRDKSLPRMSLVDAVASGDRLTALAALRDKLASELEATSGHGTAALARELSGVLRELDSLPSAEVSPLDELLARRETRSAAASN